jgi:hypothetical protein
MTASRSLLERAAKAADTSPEQALQALDEAIPPHLRSNRHGEGFLGERYDIVRAFIVRAAASMVKE